MLKINKNKAFSYLPSFEIKKTFYIVKTLLFDFLFLSTRKKKNHTGMCYTKKIGVDK